MEAVYHEIAGLSDHGRLGLVSLLLERLGPPRGSQKDANAGKADAGVGSRGGRRVLPHRVCLFTVDVT